METPSPKDPSHDFLDTPTHPLTSFFNPKSIAVIGATEAPNSVGRTLMMNLSSFKGKIYPINPKRECVLGIPCFPSLSSVKEKIDLVIIVTPAKTVPSLIDECAAAHVTSVIIISAGFKELGTDGYQLENEILLKAKNSHIRIIGPNCLGLMNPHIGLNATFAKGIALPGQMAFISQSGAMCTSVLDWSLKKKIGFSAFVSIGSMADINWGDLIDYLGNDPNTQSILIYMESVGDPRAFLSAAKQVALSKPIIVIKAGKTLQAAIAAASHTGSLAGSDEVFDAALHRAGVLRVDTISELFNMALVLATQPIPKGPNLAIITNAGGPGVLAVDALISAGGTAELPSPISIEHMNVFLPAAWSHSNPIDILGDANAERYGKTLEIVSNDPNFDGILVILSPQDMTEPEKTAEIVAKFASIPGKPIIASWMGGASVEEGENILHTANIPTFSFPDNAAQVFARMWSHSKDLRDTYITPIAEPFSLNQELRQGAVKKLLENALEEGRTLLTEFESKKVLEAYDIPVVRTLIAISKEEAISLAATLEYPIVLKLFSHTITHKSDVGGVKLNLKNKEEVAKAYDEIQAAVSHKDFHGVTVQPMIKMQDAYELILGSSLDEQFGPVILFGTGGQLVEVYKDKALGLPPLNSTLAKVLMEKTKVYEALKGVRGRKSVDLSALETILIRFSNLIAEQPRIKECDINPLLVSAERMIALDARIVLHEASLTNENLPRLSIRPYPLQYIRQSGDITLRPIRPEDEPLMVQFHQELSAETIKSRYLELLSLDERTTHNRLIRVCCSDYDRNIAIVAEHEGKIVGIARIVKDLGTNEAHLTALVIDNFQNRGLGTALIEFLIHIAKEEYIHVLKADVCTDNVQMIKVLEKLGFSLIKTDTSLIKAIKKITCHA